MSKLLRFLCLTILFLWFNPIFGNNPQIDELFQQLSSATNDSVRIEVLEMIATAYQDSAYEKGLNAWQQAIEIAKKNKMLPKLAKLYNQKYLILLRKGEFQYALSNLEQSLAIHKQLNDSCQMARVYNDMGLIYRNWGQYQVALDKYELALSLFKSVNDIEGMGLVYNNVGQIHFHHKDYINAIDCFEKYLEINQYLKKVLAVAGASNNIASAYMELGHYNQALEHYINAMRIYDSLGVELGVAIINDNIGTLYSKTGQYNDALQYHFYALDIFNNLQSRSRISHTLKNIGVAYFHINNFGRAKEYLGMSSTIAKELRQMDILSEVYLHLSNAYQETDEPYSALEYFKLHVSINDSLYKIETAERLAHIEKQFTNPSGFEVLSKSSEVNLSLTHLLYVLGFIVLLLVSTLLLMLMRFKKVSRQYLGLDKEKRDVLTLYNRIKLCNPYEMFFLEHLGYEYFSIPEELCSSGSCFKFFAGKNTIILVTIHIYSTLSITAHDQRLIIGVINDTITSRLKDNNPSPLAIIDAINHKFTSMHLYTANEHGHSSIRLGCMTLYTETKELSYYGDNPAWLVSEKGELVRLFKSDQKEPEKHLYMLGSKIYLFSTPNTHLLLPQGSESIELYLEKTINALSSTPFMQQREVLESSIEFWRNSFKEPNPLLSLCFKIEGCDL